jgi:succinoglycan biosynthesis protein ExoA
MNLEIARNVPQDIRERFVTSPAKPQISVIIACRNEADHIGACLNSLFDGFTDRFCEFIITDGMSTDATRDIIQSIREQRSNVVLIDNLGKLQAHGLNAALQICRGDVVVRADAHSTYPPGYVRSCVELLASSGASNVGGCMFPDPSTGGAFQQAVAIAMRHWIGIGNARFHRGSYTGCVDTVYLGTFSRCLVTEIGGYDEHAHPAEDAELNHRLRRAGGKILLDSSIRVSYVPRNSWSALIRQYAGYARGRAYMVSRYKGAFGLRHIVPPLLVLAILFSVTMARTHPTVLLLPLAYFASLCLAAVVIPQCGGTRVRSRLPVVLATMHLTWGTVFLGRLTKLTMAHMFDRLTVGCSVLLEGLLRAEEPPSVP